MFLNVYKFIVSLLFLGVFAYSGDIQGGVQTVALFNLAIGSFVLIEE